MPKASANKAPPALSSESRKRPRGLGQDENASNLSSAACDQCRFRKVRCDRRQPECSNCSKAGITCNQTSNFKRVNHTKQLRDDFSNVLCRLEEINENLGALTRQINELPQSSAQHAAPNSHSVNQQQSSSTGSPGSRSKSPEEDNLWPNSVLPSSHLQRVLGGLRESNEDKHLTAARVELEHGGERTYKYPAAMILLKSLSRRLADGFQVADSDMNDEEKTRAAFTQAMMLRKLEPFPFQDKCLQPVVSSDRRPIIAPPQMITRLFIDGFLRNINSRIPIFDEKSLRDAVDTYYSGVPQVASSLSPNTPSVLSVDDHATDSPWAIIFTNIALLELGLETHVTHWQGSLGGSSLISTSLLTEDLITSFLRNCERALADLTPYTRPSLLNVQVLLTLALVAQEFYGNVLFEKVVRTACHVGRMSGLHLFEPNNGSSKDRSERERIFRVLYGMDKQRVFLTGDPCDLYHFDSDLELWKGMRTNKSDVVSSSPSQRLITAFDDMMIVWEEIYLKLYSVRAIAAGAAYSSSQVAGLLQLLTKWHEHHRGAMETTADSLNTQRHTIGGGRDADDFVSTQFELKYCYHVTHLLVLQYDQSKDDQAQPQMCHHARTCLRLIVEMGNMGKGTVPTPSHLAKSRLASLARVLGNYPMVAFIYIVAFRLNQFMSSRPPPSADESREIDADIELIHAVPRILQGLQHADRPSTYLNRSRLGLEWAVRVLDETRKAWLMGLQGEELSAIASIPNSPGRDPAAAVSRDGSASIITPNWERMPSTPQQRRSRNSTSSNEMDLDIRMSPSEQPQISAGSGFTPGSLDLSNWNFSGMDDPIENWSTIPFLDGIGEIDAGVEIEGEVEWEGRGEEGGAQMARTKLGECGLYGLGVHWQDIFPQKKPDVI